MRVLGLSMVYPNPVQPNHGVFVRERWRWLARRHEITVIAPVPHFPLATGRMKNRPVGVPGHRRDGDLDVRHPRFWSAPAVGKSLDGALYAASIWPLVRRLHREHPFDLIDAHFAYPDGFAGVLVARQLGIPATVTLRGTLADFKDMPSRRWALRRTLASADAVLSVSAALAADAADLGLPIERVTVVPNGIDTALFVPSDRDAARDRLGLPRDRRLIVSVGALREVKGHHHLLEALVRVRDRLPGVMAAIVGGAGPSGDRAEWLRRRTAELGLAEHVVWAGDRSHDEIPIWLAAADVFALASRREGCCNALLEALACDRPAVATAVGGNPEILSSPSLGRLVPPADPPALAEALVGVLGRDREPGSIRTAVVDRGWDRTAAAVARVWAAVLEDRARAAHGSGVTRRSAEAGP